MIAGPALLSITLTPKTQADWQKLRQAWQTLTTEQPAMRFTIDDATNQAVIAAMNPSDLEVVIDRLRREFAEASVGPLQIAYKETVTQPADGDGRFVRQAAGVGQYGHARIHLYPGERGSGVVFQKNITGGSIPTQFREPTEEGIKEAMARGILAGYPMDDVRVELYDGSYHEKDSTEMTFKLAGSLAFQDAARKAHPVLLEPVMRVRLGVPKEKAADLLNDLLARRARIESRDDNGAMQNIEALVPLAELIGYAAEFRQQTRGVGTCSVTVDGYQPCRLKDDDDHPPQMVVGLPQKPPPTPRPSGIALPEPDED